MYTPELGHLVSQDTPIADIDSLPGKPRRRASWFLAGTAALLLGGSITASLAGSAGEPSQPVHASTVAEEAPRPRQGTTTALVPDSTDRSRALPPRAESPERPDLPL